MLARQRPALICLAFPLLLTAPKPAEASHSYSSHHSRRSATATFFRQGDSNPRLANGDYYGSAGPWFCAVDESRRGLLNHRIRVVNRQNGRSHIFLVADLGRFPRGNVDISRGGSSRLSGRGGPDNFPVEWHDLGLAPSQRGQKHHGHKHHARHREER
jgi:hypothetical protein